MATYNGKINKKNINISNFTTYQKCIFKYIYKIYIFKYILYIERERVGGERSKCTRKLVFGIWPKVSINYTTIVQLFWKYRQNFKMNLCFDVVITIL